MLRFTHTTDNPASFSTSDSDKELLSIIESGACILVVGPDISRQQWNEEYKDAKNVPGYLDRLLRGMIEWCIRERVISQPNRIARIRQLLHSGFLVQGMHYLEEFLVGKSRFHNCLKEILQSESQLTQTHLALVRLPFRGYVATTYDTLIETAYQQVNQRDLTKFYVSSVHAAIAAYKHRQPFILKLYGDIDNTDTLDLRGRLINGFSAIDEQNALRSLLAMSPVLLTGFGEADPDLKWLTRMIQDRLVFKQIPLSWISMLDGRRQNLENRHPQEHKSGQIISRELNMWHPEFVAFSEATSLLAPRATIDRSMRKPDISIPSPQTRSIPGPVETEQAPPIEIYTTYVSQDIRYFKRMKTIYDTLKRQQYHISCHESEVTKNFSWQQEDHLRTAHLILLLVSPDFLETDFCYHTELAAAVKRHGRGQCYIVPILLRPLSSTFLKNTPFGMLECLPGNDKTVSEWKNRDQAFKCITDYILEKLEELKYYNG